MATIKDVARQAGVSVSTASRALNDNSRISDATKERVRQVAQQLGYRLNYTAKSLTSGKSNIVGLVLPVTDQEAVANPFHLDLMRGIAARLAPHHFEMAVAIGQSSGELLAHVRSLVENANITKFLLFYSVAGDPVAAYLRTQDVDFVVIGRPKAANDRFVDSDNRLAGYQAARYLLSHRQVARPLFVMSAERWSYEEERWAGMQDYLAERRLPAQCYVFGQSVRRPPYDSIVASDDINYLRFVAAPGGDHDLAALPGLCFNNSRLLGMLTPQVIKVDLLPRKIGRVAVDLLFNPQQHRQLVDFRIIDHH